MLSAASTEIPLKPSASQEAQLFVLNFTKKCINLVQHAPKALIMACLLTSNSYTVSFVCKNSEAARIISFKLASAGRLLVLGKVGHSHENNLRSCNAFMHFCVRFVHLSQSPRLKGEQVSGTSYASVLVSPVVLYKRKADVLMETSLQACEHHTNHLDVKVL